MGVVQGFATVGTVSGSVNGRGSSTSGSLASRTPVEGRSVPQPASPPRATARRRRRQAQEAAA
ncbi:hypothetical protein ACFQ3Z_25545 [Streptomyces nogalater]